MEFNLKKIIFVDDDTQILDSLNRIFFDMEDEWNMEFASSGQEALEKMKNQEYDVIVSDMRMPEMNGAELLKEVKRLYPSTVRIMLSGYTNKEMILQTIDTVDQFLAKPINPELLKNILKNMFEAKDDMAANKENNIFSQIKKFPTLPQIYYDLLELLNSSSSSMKDIAEIINKDVVITAKIMQLVNSAFFGLRRRVEDLKIALSYLGIETVKSIILLKDVFDQFTEKEVEFFELDSLYNHSTYVGMLCKRIMESITNDKSKIDKACMAGLLHDIGVLLMIKNFEKQYEQVYALYKDKGIPLYKIEEKVWGTNHAQIGGYLIQKWGLPIEIGKSIFQHHNSFYALRDVDKITFPLFCSNLLYYEQKGFFDLKKIVLQHDFCNDKQLKSVNQWIKLNDELKNNMEK